MNENLCNARILSDALTLLTDFINEIQLPIAAPYAVSKAALTTLTAKFAAAYANQGILFASICPGRVDTAEPGATGE